MKSVLEGLLDLFMRYVLALVTLLAAAGIVFGLQAMDVSENVAGAVAVVFMVGFALTVVVYSRRKAAERSRGATE